MSTTVVAVEPILLDRDNSAAVLGVSVSTLELLTRTDATFPKPRQVSGRRVGWLLSELRHWGAQRPVSDQAPPANTGAAKPRARRAGESPAATESGR